MPYLFGNSSMAPLTGLALRPRDAPSETSSDEVQVTDWSAVLEARRASTVNLIAKNRRKHYLEVHPEYFEDSSLEFADPILYDRLIRRFQTAAEREAKGRRTGHSGVLSTDLYRAVEKQEALYHSNPNSLLFTYNRGPNGEILEEEKDDIPMSKEEGKAWWIDEMTQRFLRGDDNEFDYKKVDGNDKYNDPEEKRDLEEAYFNSMDSDFDSDGEGKEKVLLGETGIQDY